MLENEVIDEETEQKINHLLKETKNGSIITNG